jgi:HNH endonuclease
MARNSRNRIVLLLNSTYEVLGRIEMNRAILLLWAGKAYPFEVLSEDWLHGPPDADGKRFSMQIPVSIILKNYAHVDYADIAPMDDVMAGRMAILHRDGFVCSYCLAPASTIDHVYPQSKGGGNLWTNLVAACTDCNSLKADMTLEEFERKHGKKLLRQPFVPDSNKYAREQATIWDKISSGSVDIPEQLE